MPKLVLPQLIAHRGASIYAPENTLAALRRAAELGASWVEADVMLTADGEAVILHDQTLDRTTNGKGEVATASLAAIRELDAGNWFAAEFKHERVPTLDEWLSCAAALNLGLNLELKVPAYFAEPMVKKLLESLKGHWSGDYSQLLISSFTHANLRAVHQADANLPLGFLIREWSDKYQKELENLNCASINMSYRFLTPQVLKKLKQYGCPILAYTVDDKALAEQLFDWGVTSVFSNDPCLLAK